MRGNPPVAPEIRFERFVDRSGECWLWTGQRNRAGYGYLRVGSMLDGSRRRIGAHVFALQSMLGRPLRPGHIAAHHCDNPSCVRPDHLFETTHAGNIADKLAKGRGRVGLHPGASNCNARLTDEAVAAIRARYAAGGISQQQLASEYGVSQHTISWIVRGRGWQHVTEH